MQVNLNGVVLKLVTLFKHSKLTLSSTKGFSNLFRKGLCWKITGKEEIKDVEAINSKAATKIK